ncbi:MAG: hypothetical protein ACP6IY_19595 [Promethearchaeia archaeon]
MQSEISPMYCMITLYSEFFYPRQLIAFIKSDINYSYIDMNLVLEHHLEIKEANDKAYCLAEISLSDNSARNIFRFYLSPDLYTNEGVKIIIGKDIIDYYIKSGAPIKISPKKPKLLASKTKLNRRPVTIDLIDKAFKKFGSFIKVSDVLGINPETVYKMLSGKFKNQREAENYIYTVLKSLPKDKYQKAIREIDSFFLQKISEKLKKSGEKLKSAAIKAKEKIKTTYERSAKSIKESRKKLVSKASELGTKAGSAFRQAGSAAKASGKRIIEKIGEGIKFHISGNTFSRLINFKKSLPEDITIEQYIKEVLKDLKRIGIWKELKYEKRLRNYVIYFNLPEYGTGKVPYIINLTGEARIPIPNNSEPFKIYFDLSWSRRYRVVGQDIVKQILSIFKNEFNIVHGNFFVSLADIYPLHIEATVLDVRIARLNSSPYKEMILSILRKDPYGLYFLCWLGCARDRNARSFSDEYIRDREQDCRHFGKTNFQLERESFRIVRYIKRSDQSKHIHKPSKIYCYLTEKGRLLYNALVGNNACNYIENHYNPQNPEEFCQDFANHFNFNLTFDDYIKLERIDIKRLTKIMLPKNNYSYRDKMGNELRITYRGEPAIYRGFNFNIIFSFTCAKCKKNYEKIYSKGKIYWIIKKEEGIIFECTLCKLNYKLNETFSAFKLYVKKKSPSISKSKIPIRKPIRREKKEEKAFIDTSKTKVDYSTIRRRGKERFYSPETLWSAHVLTDLRPELTDDVLIKSLSVRPLSFREIEFKLGITHWKESNLLLKALERLERAGKIKSRFINEIKVYEST